MIPDFHERLPESGIIAPTMMTDLPLFPLATVLFPGGLLTLQVFEVRYLDMIGACQASERPFGVVALASGHEVRQAGAAPEQLCDVGTLATIEHCERPRPGLMLLSCRGVQRFRLHQPHCLPHGLWQADAELLTDDARIAIPADLKHTSDRLRQVLHEIRQRHPGVAQPTEAQLADCGWVANRWCELIPARLSTKQQLMSLQSPLLRLELVTDLLDSPRPESGNS